MNFLIIDDQNAMRRSVRVMLGLINYGNRYFEAADGRRAWLLLNGKYGKEIDFIICDYAMPFMTGTELLSRVRRNKKLRDIPFLMITAEANNEIVAEAAEHDVDAYLTKPFVTASLEHKVNELLEKAFSPNELAQHLRAARDYEEKGDFPAAIDEARKASDINQRSSRPFRELGRLLLKNGDQHGALKYFEKAVGINGLDVSSFDYLGQIYFAKGDFDRAINYFSRAMQISPRQSERALNFADLLAKKEKPEEAEKVLQIVFRNNAANPEIIQKIADQARELKLFNLSVKSYRAILKYDPENILVHKNIGLALQQKGMNNEAVFHLEKAVEVFHQDIDLLMALARLYLGMKRFVRADKWAGKVLHLQPENKEARSIMAQCV